MPSFESEAPPPSPRGCLHLLVMLFALFFILSHREPKPSPATDMAETEI